VRAVETAGTTLGLGLAGLKPRSDGVLGRRLPQAEAWGDFPILIEPRAALTKAEAWGDCPVPMNLVRPLHGIPLGTTARSR